MGLSAAGISVFFIDNVPLLRLFKGQITLNFELFINLPFLRRHSDFHLCVGLL